WNRLQEQMKQFSDSNAPQKDAYEKEWKQGRKNIISRIQELFTQLEQSGIDLSGAKVKFDEATIHYAHPRKPGSLEGMIAQQMQMDFTVQSDRKSKTGASVAGAYGIGLKYPVRLDGAWKVERDIRWNKFPEGVLSEKDAADFEFENYVSEHRTLPP